jgi:hypothetical protein
MTDLGAAIFKFAANGASATRGRRKWQQGADND